MGYVIAIVIITATAIVIGWLKTRDHDPSSWRERSSEDDRLYG